MIVSLVVSFLITVAVELAVGWLLGLRDRRSLVIIFLVNVVTNPVVVFLLNVEYLYGLPVGRIPLTLFLEVSAVIVEALLYRISLKTERNPFLIALILNFASYGAGILINILLRQVL